MVESLVRQGETITRFIFSSTRSGVIRNMRMHHIGNENLILAVQASLDQALDHPGINFIHVVSGQGVILASTIESKIGQRLNESQQAFFEQVHNVQGAEYLERLLKNTEVSGTVFQYIQLRPFHLPSKSIDPGQQRQGDFRNRKGMRKEFDFFRENLSHMMQDEAVILIELDATPYEAVVKRQLVQIGALSIVLLLVGVGGWLSINTLQRLKGSQTQLKSVETLQNLLVASLPVGIIAVDENNTMQVVNPEAERLFSISSADVLKKDISTLLPGDILSHLGHDSQKKSGITEFEHIFKSSEGTTKIYYIYSLIIDDEAGQSKGRLLLVQDVSDLREMERTLRKNERFAALGKVAAGVAHELRNPLSSIKGLAVLTGKKLENNEHGKTTVELMIKEVDRLDRSIRELLEFAKPEMLDLRKYTFKKLVNEALEIFETDFSSRNIRVITKIENPVQVKADKDKIKQVFLNIFLNAIQAVKDDGEITISLYQEKGAAICSVSDNGGGVDPKIIDKVFDPYFTTKNEGTGLGLAISVKIVEEHGGSLNIESINNQGTTVYLHLPAIS